MFDMLIRWFI